jgi:hypothetical protein
MIAQLHARFTAAPRAGAERRRSVVRVARCDQAATSASGSLLGVVASTRSVRITRLPPAGLMVMERIRVLFGRFEAEAS